MSSSLRELTISVGAGTGAGAGANSRSLKRDSSSNTACTMLHQPDMKTFRLLDKFT